MITVTDLQKRLTVNDAFWLILRVLQQISSLSNSYLPEDCLLLTVIVVPTYASFTRLRTSRCH